VQFKEEARTGKTKAQDVLKSSRAKRRLDFPAPEDAPSRKVSKGPLGPKGPRVRIVTKLDKAYEAQTKVDKSMKRMMWAQKKLRDSGDFLKCLQSRPQRIAGVMFEVLTKEELVAVAKKFAANCAQDALEEVLQSYRYIALDKVSNLFSAKCREAMTISADLKKLRAEVSGPTEDVAAATGPKEEADAGPKEEADAGPKEEADAGPKKEYDAGPKVDGGDKDAGPMATPAQEQFQSRSHWIASARSSSGYKGVIADTRRGWRVKHGNNTIGRFDNKEQACEAYYDYCKRYGLL